MIKISKWFGQDLATLFFSMARLHGLSIDSQPMNISWRLLQRKFLEQRKVPSVSHTFEATESYVLSIFCPACLRYSKCATSFSKRSKEGIGGPKSTWSQHKNRLDRLDFLRKKNTWRTCRLDFFHNLAEGHAAFVEVYQLLHTTRRCLTQSHLRREAGLLAVKIFTNDGKKALAEVQLQ